MVKVEDKIKKLEKKIELNTKKIFRLDRHSEILDSNDAKTLKLLDELSNTLNEIIKLWKYLFVGSVIVLMLLFIIFGWVGL